jgi:hypothetical protein
MYYLPNIIRMITVKKNETHRSCSTYGEEESCRQFCGGTNLKERENFESLGFIGE